MLKPLKLNSPDHLSLLLFGGNVEETYDEPIKNPDGTYVCYKSGPKVNEIKYQKRIRSRRIVGMGLRPLPEWARDKKGYFNTSKDILQLISQREGSEAGEFVKTMLQHRSITKEISTYYDSTLEQIDEEGFVHTQFESVHIPTGRVSSKYINMQNQPGSGSSKVKQHFLSRYQDGVIIQADYKQIEVIVFAYLCNDKTLCNLLINKKDIHRFIASTIYNKSEEEIDDALRKKTKAVTFTITYGGGPGKIAANTGLSVPFCKEVIQTFYDLFPNARVWHDYIVKQVEHKGQLELFTGRIVKFKKFPAKFSWQFEKGIAEAFNPSQVKDYPVQAMAGDILFTMLGVLWRKAILHRDKFLLINTVHDSIILDCRPEYQEFASNLVKTTLDNWGDVVYNYWNVKWELPTIVELSTGKTWYDCK